MPTYSLTEIETHCRKAARGAGYHWGEAEEAGKAVRWLCTAGLDGATEVLELLQAVDGRTVEYRATSAVFSSEPQEKVCGLSLGCAIADRGVGALDNLTLNTSILCPMITYGVIGNALVDVNLDNLSKLLDIHHEANWPQTDISKNTWDALNIFVHRTYVPATEESRLKGAG
jgi:hypothetical protein